MATTIPEAVTTIPARTLRLLLTSISYRAKARKELRRKPPMVPRRPPLDCPPGGGCQNASRRADPEQVETLTPQQVRRVCTADSVSALANDPHTVGADPAGLAWSVAVLTCAASGRDGGIWYVLDALRRCDTLQRGADSVISAFVGLVLWAAECVKPQEKHL